MTASGTVWEDGGTTSAPLFQNPFYATGYEIAEAYQATVEVGGSGIYQRSDSSPTVSVRLLQCGDRHIQPEHDVSGNPCVLTCHHC